MDDFHQIVNLLELFNCPNNEIRAESEQAYQYFERNDPEKTIQLLFEIINSSVSFNIAQQALIRLKLFLQNSISSEPIVSLEIANRIKSTLLDFIAQSDNTVLAKYSLSIILDFYFKSYSNESMWENFLQYIVDLYQIKPLLSLYSLTLIYDTYPNQEVALQIYACMVFDNDPQIFIQSLISGLILIKNRFKFEDIDQFASLLTRRFSNIPDEELVKPLETFHRSFLSFYDPFAPFLEDIFKYILEIIADLNRNENIRVQCMYIFTNFFLNNTDFRSISLSSPRDVAMAVAYAISEPYKFTDIYKEAKKSLRIILEASMGDLNVFDESLEEFGLEENMYVKSIFLYHNSSEVSLNFAFENVFSEDQVIRHNCLKIIFNMIKPQQNMEDKSSEEDNSIREQIEDKIADIFVQYFRESNFEIYKFFKGWCLQGGSNSLNKCIDPIIELLQNKCENENLFLIASLLCARYLDLPVMQEVASDLLEYAKNCITEQKEDKTFLEIVKNLLPNLDSESKTKLLDEIIPNIFNSAILTLSLDFVQIIEVLKQDFIPYLPNYLEVLFSFALNLNSKDVDAEEIEDNSETTSVTTNADTEIILNDSDLKNLRYMLQSLDTIIMNYIEICKAEETILTNIIKIINNYLSFQLDDEVQLEAIMLCFDFVRVYYKDCDIDLILYIIDSVIKGVEVTFNIINLSLFSTFTYFVVQSKPEHVKYIDTLLPLIFSNSTKAIQTINEKYQYFDGSELYYIREMFKNLENSFYLIFNIDINYAISIFHQIIEIVPYFKLPYLDDEIKRFISAIWVDFVSFSPSDQLPDPIPDLLNDLFEFYYNTYNNKIKKSIIFSIGTLVDNVFPQLSPSVITELEKIILNEEESIGVRQKACIQCALLAIECDQETLESKLDDIIQMASLFPYKSKNNGLFCIQLIDIAKYATKHNFDEQIFQKVFGIIKLFIDQELLNTDDLMEIIDICKEMNVLE